MRTVRIRFLLLLLLSLLSLGACTQEANVKNAAREAALKRLQDQLRTEAQGLTAAKARLRENFERTVLERTAVDVEPLEIGADAARVLVDVKTVPEPVRRSLVDLLLKLEPAKENAFNVPDSLPLIRRQLGLPEDAVDEKKYQLRLRKRGLWEVSPGS